MREAVTPLIPCIKPGCRLIFIARQPIVDEKLPDIRSSMRYSLKRAGYLNTNPPQEKENRGQAMRRRKRRKAITKIAAGTRHELMGARK